MPLTIERRPLGSTRRARARGLLMDIYHVWCNLEEGVDDIEFTDAVRAYLEHLKAENQLRAYRIMRRKLGLAPGHLAEFHIMLEFENLTELDRAFRFVSTRSDPVEALHHAVNSKVKDVSFALYRDFPDPHRARGEERF